MSRNDLEALNHDTALRWRVTSRSRPEVEHLVDLDAYGGNGRCTCEHFHYRIEPGLTRGGRIGRATRCSHILVARNAFADLMIQALSKNSKQQQADAI